MAPTRTLSTPVAVEGEYRQAAGSETLWSSQMVSCPSSGPSSAPRIGRAYRLPLSCWRTRKTIPHDIVAPFPGQHAPHRRAGHYPFWVSGSSTWKRVSPGLEVKRRSPWWRWTTIRQLMSRPRPVPLPTALVV